jgi:pimeloyl-ACP methyl ester carboxylesterase
MFESVVRKFLYYPTTIPVAAPLPPYARDAREVWITTPAGGRIHSLHWPAPDGRPTILFFHGNAQTVYEWAWIREELSPLDCGLLLIDYPGYGKSDGAPSEAALGDAGEASFAWLEGEGGVAAEKMVIFGKSLGGGVAAKVATGRRLRGLVLESTFTSIPGVARHLLPFLPGGMLLKSEVYNTVGRLPRIVAPILIVHGVADQLIPVREAHTLFEKANEPKRLYLVEGAGHADVALTAGAAYGATLREWLDGTAGS